MKKLMILTMFICILGVLTFVGCVENTNPSENTSKQAKETPISATATESAKNPPANKGTTDTSKTHTTTPPIDDEKQIGYITKLYEESGVKYLNIDYIQWLTGEAAIKAIMENLHISRKDAEKAYTNDYYIRNQNSQIRKFKISDTATYTSTLVNPAGDKSNFNDMKKRIESSKLHLLCHITLKNNEVIDVHEQYTP